MEWDTILERQYEAFRSSALSPPAFSFTYSHSMKTRPCFLRILEQARERITTNTGTKGIHITVQGPKISTDSIDSL
jgi:hypothetical protein